MRRIKGAAQSSASSNQDAEKPAICNTRTVQMLAFLGRGTNEALLRKVASHLKPCLSVKPYRGETDGAGAALKRVTCELVFLGSWKGYEEVFAASSRFSFVNRMPQLFELCHKSTLCDILTKARVVSAPESLVLPRDRSQVKAWTQEGDCLILKPSDGAKGDCIRVFPPGDGQETAVLRAASGRAVDENSYVLQHYISSPLLLHSRKFDLRLYLAFVFDEGGGTSGGGAQRGSGSIPSSSFTSSTGSAFLCSHGLARLCSVPYEPPDDENCAHARMHLTNFAVNKSDVNKGIGIGGGGVGNNVDTAAPPLKMSVAAALKEVVRAQKRGLCHGNGQPELSVEGLWEGVRNSSHQVAAALLPHLRTAVDQWSSLSSAAAAGSRASHDSALAASCGDDGDENHGDNSAAEEGKSAAMSSCSGPDARVPRRRFQLTGLDIMFDGDGTPKVLELNANPSLSIHGEDGVSIEAVDDEVKVPMLLDLLKLCVLRRNEEGSLSGLMTPGLCDDLCWESLCSI